MGTAAHLTSLVLVTYLGIQLRQSQVYPLTLALPFPSDTVGHMAVQSRATFLSFLPIEVPCGLVPASSVYVDMADWLSSSPSPSC